MLANEVLDQFATLFPQALVTTPAEGFRELIFPRMDGNEYWFHLAVGHGLLQLGAWLGEAGKPQAPFWYMPFEPDEGTQEVELFQRISLEVLLHRTRITQVRGMLFCTFLCEAWHEGVWTRVYKNGYFRPTIRGLPRIVGRRHVYTADKMLLLAGAASSPAKS